MDMSKLWQDVANAVETAQEKRKTMEELKSELATYTASKQAQIDAATTEYTDAKVAAERLQDQVRATIGEILPAADARVRVSA